MDDMFLLDGSGGGEPRAIFRLDGMTREEAEQFLAAMRRLTPRGEHRLSLVSIRDLDVPAALVREREVELTQKAAAPNWIGRNNNRPLQEMLGNARSVLTRIRERSRMASSADEPMSASKAGTLSATSVVNPIGIVVSSAPEVTPPAVDMPGGFDAFLSYNSKDVAMARELKSHLVARDLAVWFDEEELRPGVPWQVLLESGIRAANAVLVTVGSNGIGPWENEEMRGALQQAVERKLPVIPVLLPGAGTQPDLPMFLASRTWVNLRDGFISTAIDKVVWGITGKKPPPLAPATS